MTDLTHGPVTAQMIQLLTPGRSVLLRPDGEARLFKHHAGNGQLIYLERSDAYWRALVTYIGERDDDGWITAPKGGWKSNPVPGRVVDAQTGHGGLVNSLSGLLGDGWQTALRFRLADPQPATPPAPADDLEVVAWRVRCKSELEAWSLRHSPAAHERGEAQPLVLKSAAEACIAEQRAETERLRGLLPVWVSPDIPPSVPVGGEEWKIVAVRRAHNGRVYRFPATYLNQRALHFEHTEEERVVTGWFTVTSDDGDDLAYHETLGPGDALEAWCDLPSLPDTLTKIGEPR